MADLNHLSVAVGANIRDWWPHNLQGYRTDHLCCGHSA